MYFHDYDTSCNGSNFTCGNRQMWQPATGLPAAQPPEESSNLARQWQIHGGGAEMCATKAHTNNLLLLFYFVAIIKIN